MTTEKMTVEEMVAASMLGARFRLLERRLCVNAGETGAVTLDPRYPHGIMLDYFHLNRDHAELLELVE